MPSVSRRREQIDQLKNVTTRYEITEYKQNCFTAGGLNHKDLEIVLEWNALGLPSYVLHELCMFLSRYLVSFEYVDGLINRN